MGRKAHGIRKRAQAGSAAWMYRLMVESPLELRLQVGKLRFAPPCLPTDWEGFKMHYRYRETVYHIAVLQTPAGDGLRHQGSR
jgi:cyclic beta-1,2-glucan synthetase